LLKNLRQPSAKDASLQNIVTCGKAFTTDVHPILEYNSPVWSPTLKEGRILLIEAVQGQFTKRIPGMSGLTIQSSKF